MERYHSSPEGRLGRATGGCGDIQDNRSRPARYADISCRALVSPWVLSYLAGPPLFTVLPTSSVLSSPNREYAVLVMSWLRSR